MRSKITLVAALASITITGCVGGSDGAASAPVGQTYTSQEACEQFAMASCSSAIRCGLVLDTDEGLFCFRRTVCSEEEFIKAIGEGCLRDAMQPSYSADTVDLCTSEARDIPCDKICGVSSIDGAYAAACRRLDFMIDNLDGTGEPDQCSAECATGM